MFLGYVLYISYHAIRLGYVLIWKYMLMCVMPMYWICDYLLWCCHKPCLYAICAYYMLYVSGEAVQKHQRKLAKHIFFW